MSAKRPALSRNAAPVESAVRRTGASQPAGAGRRCGLVRLVLRGGVHHLPRVPHRAVVHRPAQPGGERRHGRVRQVRGEILHRFTGGPDALRPGGAAARRCSSRFQPTLPSDLHPRTTGIRLAPMPSPRIDDSRLYAHFVHVSCKRRRRLLDADRAEQVVLGRTQFTACQAAARCVGFVIMPDHVHAIVWFPQPGQLSHFMQQWKQRASFSIKQVFRTHFPRYARWIENDAVWQPRYYAFHIHSRDKLERSSRTCIGIRSAPAWFAARASGNGVRPGGTRNASSLGCQLRGSSESGRRLRVRWGAFRRTSCGCAAQTQGRLGHPLFGSPGASGTMRRVCPEVSIRTSHGQVPANCDRCRIEWCNSGLCVHDADHQCLPRSRCERCRRLGDDRSGGLFHSERLGIEADSACDILRRTRNSQIRTTTGGPDALRPGGAAARSRSSRVQPTLPSDLHPPTRWNQTSVTGLPRSRIPAASTTAAVACSTRRRVPASGVLPLHLCLQPATPCVLRIDCRY